MARNNSPIVQKETRYRTNKAGKKVKSGVNLTREDGSKFTLLNPSGKSAKYYTEIQRGKHYTNAGLTKTDEDGNFLELTDNQRAYRSGYLDAQKDNAKAYKAKKEKRAKKKRVNVNWSNYRSHDFDYDDYGNIKGSYTVDGRFEPD